MVIVRTTVVMLWVGLGNVAWAQSQVPDRQIPPSVLTELRLVENRFDIALAADCDAERCFSKGCTYVDHAVADQPRSKSLPGLGQDPGPGSVGSQEYLTQAYCSFAYEDSADAKDVQGLARRLQSKLTKGWTVVAVGTEPLQPLAPYLQQPPEEAEEIPLEPEEEVVDVKPADGALSGAIGELWSQLLPHFFWMIGLALFTIASVLLIWAWRRVGRESVEEQMLMAELMRGDAGPNDDSDDEPSPEPVDESDFVAEQQTVWTERLQAIDAANPDLELQALIRELLRTGELPLLAKAVLHFPERFPTAFPEGGEVAEAKLALADYLKTVDADKLPSDADFFKRLNRHALSAALMSQSDAQMVRSLREEFGAFGLASLIGRLPPRPGALLFALAPTDEQHEMVRLIAPQKVAELAEMLLRSNRMDPVETAHLFGVVTAVRANQPIPAAPSSDAISDRGAEFNAVGALSVLLESVNSAQRSALFGEALERFQGGLPSWYRGILLADMLLQLSTEARADLMLEVDVETLAAWLSLVETSTQDRLLSGLPDALRTSVRASSVFPSRAVQLAKAEQGRQDLARAFQLQIARSGVSFESVVRPKAQADS